ncbi:MAG: FG-GAP repeat domain-containing protein, partial [Flavobacteriales bacterium]
MLRSVLATVILSGVVATSSLSQDPAPFLSQTEAFHVVTDNMEGFWGPGMSAVDVNGDGWDDLTFGDFFGGAKLFLNTETAFVAHDLDLGIEGECEVKGVVWGDVDNDGDQDLFLGCRGDRNRLFLNQGDLSLVDV